MGIISRSIKNKFLDTGERTKKLVVGSGVMAISTFINTLTRVGLISLLARIYTKDQFGIWVAITSATAVMGTSDFGIGNALRNKLAELRTKGKEGDSEARNYFLSVVYFFLFTTIIISIILLLCKNYIPYELVFKTHNSLLQSQGVDILVVVEIIFLIGIPIGIGSTMFFAYQETNIFAIFNIVNGILGILIVGILGISGESIVVTAISFFIITLVINTIATFYFLYKRKWVLTNFIFGSIFKRIKKLLALSFTFAILQISGAFIYNTVTLVATANISLSDAAQLNLVQKLYTVVVALYLSFYNPLWAGYADAIFINDWKWVKKMLIKTIQITTLLFGCAIFTFTIWGNFFLNVLAGSNYVSQTKLFFSMGLWALFYCLYSMGVAFLSALSKIKLITSVTALFALSFISMATYLSNKMGIFGISYLSAIMYGILALITYVQSFYLSNQRSLN